MRSDTGAGNFGIPYAGGIGMAPSTSGGSGNSMMDSLIGGGLLGGGIGQLFGLLSNNGPSPSSYIGQIPGQVKPYLEPYMQAGQSQLSPLAGIYGNLTNDPGAMLNQIGMNYHQSPGFQFGLNQALQGAGHAAAAGGMAGSPMAQQQAQQIGTQLGNQDYYNWLNQATNMFGQGLQGRQQLAGMGQEAGESMANMISQALAEQAAARYAQQAQQNQQAGGIGSLLGAGAGFAFGGPGGAIGGSALGKSLFG